MPRVLCLPRDKHNRVLGVVKRFLQLGMRGGWRVRRLSDRLQKRSALIREAPDIWAGDEAESWHARDGNGPHPQSKNTKREAVLSRLFVWRNRLRFAGPAGCASLVPASRRSRWLFCGSRFPLHRADRMLTSSSSAERSEGRGSSERVVEDAISCPKSARRAPLAPFPVIPAKAGIQASLQS